MDLIGRLKKAGQWCYSQKQESVRNFGLFGSRPVSEDGKVGDKAITRQTAQDGTEVTSGID
jgi:predicted Rossmann fold nucleotide-binding protein DprA/Smf involved in DNA uptake